jgi:hypothetical protein
MPKKYYTKEEFMNLCNINNRSRLHQLLFGFNQKKGDKIYNMDMIYSVLSNLNYEMAKRDTGKTIQELLETGECGTHIYDKYFTNANNYKYL